MKIYNEVILIWNDTTNQFDTVYEDSYDHDGPMLHAQKDDKINWKRKKAEVSDVKDLIGEIEDDIKKAGGGMKDWSKATKNLNTSLEESIRSLGKNENMTQRMVTMTQGLRMGTMDHVDLERQLTTIKQEQEQTVRDIEANNIKAARAQLRGNNDLAAQYQEEASAHERRKETLKDEELHTKKMIPLSKELSAEAEKKTNQAKIDDTLFGGMIGKAKELGKQLTTPWGIAAVAAGLLATIFLSVSKITDDIGNSFGAIGVNTDSMYDSLVDARSTAIGLGYDFSEVAGSVETLTDTLGIGIDEAAKLSETTMDTAKALGMGTSEAAGLFAIIANTTSVGQDGADQFMKQTAMLAKSAKVAPKAILNDMASSSEEIATYTKGTGDNMVKGAIFAKKMGMSLSDMAKVADSLLDFESSLTAEMETSMLIGRQLNLQRARQLALEGNLKDMGKEILNQIGSETEFNKMNAIQRKALAGSIGVSVAQMARMVKEAGKGTAEIKNMRDMDISELVGDEAMSNFTWLLNTVKQIGAEIIGGWAKTFKNMDIKELRADVESFFVSVRDIGQNISDWFVSLSEGPGIVANLQTEALKLWDTIKGWLITFGVIYGLIQLFPLILSGIGGGGTAAGVGLGAMAVGGTAAIPVLLSIAAVAAGIGLVFFGMAEIFKAMPSIIQVLVDNLSKLKDVSALQILGLAGAFTALSIALGLVAVTGTLAIPALAAVAGVGAIALKLGMGGGGGKTKAVTKTKSGEETVLVNIQKTLVEQNRILNTIVRDGLPFNKGVT